jgi:hypothetical protein
MGFALWPSCCKKFMSGSLVRCCAEELCYEFFKDATQGQILWQAKKHDFANRVTIFWRKAYFQEVSARGQQKRPGGGPLSFLA